MFKKSKILKIKLVKYANTPPIMSAWNIFDTEHPAFVHGNRQHGDGMEASTVLVENKDFLLTIDKQRMPFLKFIKRESLMFHYRDINNTVYQWSCFWSIPIVQKFSVTEETKDNFKHVIQYAFELTGLKMFLSPLIKLYAKKWMAATWDEDLIMKERYYKFLKLGFINMKGLPKHSSERVNKNENIDVKFPVPKINSDIKNHPFVYNKISKLFDE